MTGIILQNTVAGTVRGARIVIGPNCKIDLVEYSESLQVAAGTEVTRQVKV
jgi:hypothetical protein